MQIFCGHKRFFGTEIFSDRFNDICLLRLNGTLELNENVTKIELNTEDVPLATKCVVSGWGTTEVSYNKFKALLFLKKFLLFLID